MDSTVEAFQDAVESYDFSTARTVVDIGGGGGAFLTCLLRKYPRIRGVLFEVPSVIERVSLAQDVAPRIECVAGDATLTAPPNGDAYVLCTVLRCFDDQRTVEILNACRRAMHPASRLLACEMVMSAKPLAPFQGLDDLQALTLYGGGDRDPEAWKRLPAEAGLTLDRIQPADPGYHWVIARTADAG
jgi:ubiquinone/menaquinone biosynthesis C-methylase UbiE